MSKIVWPRQLPLALAHREARSRDDLLVTDANAYAVALLESWPAWPAPVVVLVGPAGSGKSHLVDIWCAQAGAFRAFPENIGAEAIEAASDVAVVVEDADQAGLNEEGLFYLINAVKGAKTHLLLTARSFPHSWGVTLPDLASRLRAATTVEIHEPDDMLLSGVIMKLFTDRQVAIEPHTVQFLIRRMERSLSSAKQIVNAVDSLAMERKVRVTRTLIAEVMAIS